MKIKAGDRVRLNDHGLEVCFSRHLGLSYMKQKTYTITAVGKESLTEPEETFIVEVDDPELNQLLLYDACFDLAEPAEQPSCWCHKCNEGRTVNGIPFSLTRMIVCPDCGNKRCPKASNHDFACTVSNQPGQIGTLAEQPAPVVLTEERMRELVKECGLDWQRGYVPLFDGDPTNRYAVLIEATIAAAIPPGYCVVKDEPVGTFFGTSGGVPNVQWHSTNIPYSTKLYAARPGGEG